MTLVVEQPKPQITKREPATAQFAEYKVAADVLGFRPSQLNEHLLDALLSDNHIPVYDYNEVHSYLITLIPEWLIYMWRPLRQGLAIDRPRNNGEIDSRPYDKPIPFNIIRRAALLKGKCDELEFFVSDWARAVGDPFLLVRLGSAKRVIGQWDEPGFGGLPEIS